MSLWFMEIQRRRKDFLKRQLRTIGQKRDREIGKSSRRDRGTVQEKTIHVFEVERIRQLGGKYVLKLMVSSAIFVEVLLDQKTLMYTIWMVTGGIILKRI